MDVIVVEMQQHEYNLAYLLRHMYSNHLQSDEVLVSAD